MAPDPGLHECLRPPDPGRSPVVLRGALLSDASALFSRPTLEVAPALLGAHLVHEGADGTLRRGRIVEVEAYIGEEDRASHARFGRTARNSVMYGPPGIAYVYLVYGMYDCLNIVTEPVGSPAAVLVRAVEPIEGEAAMRADLIQRNLARRRVRSGQADEAAAARIGRLPASRLAAGPGLVAAAFGIDRSLTGSDLLAVESPVRLEFAPPDELRPTIVATPRLGIAYAGPPWTEVPWRFAIAGHPSVSGARAGRAG